MSGYYSNWAYFNITFTSTNKILNNVKKVKTYEGLPLITNIYFRYCEEKVTRLTDVKIHNIKVNQSKPQNEIGP